MPRTELLSSQPRHSPLADRSCFTPGGLASLAQEPRLALYLLARSEDRALGAVTAEEQESAHRVTGVLPPLYPEWLGSPEFCDSFGLRFPYLAGEMANGISTTRMVKAMAGSGMLGFFGAGGLDFAAVERGVAQLLHTLGAGGSWGVNLIHSPQEPELERKVGDLLVRTGVPCVSASAFMELTPSVVLCSAAGLRADPSGEIVRARHVIAKVSRLEVAEQFMAPAPGDLLDQLLREGRLSEEEAVLASHIPVASAVTAEGDSGGHTDNRPLLVLLPALIALRGEVAVRHGLARPPYVGAAGGLGTPQAVAAAFALGAAYVVTGSVNQMAVESGLSAAAKALLFRAGLADTAMAPASDMFELGVTLQVLRTGTMFAPRATRLYEAYRAHASLEALPQDLRAQLEREVFGLSLAAVWEETRVFWERRDPEQLERAERDPRHRMALVFRWYLGRSSGWAISGDPARRLDYQIWCGPAAGGFNQWVRGSFLARPEECSVVQIGLNLMEGAAVVTRAQQIRQSGRAVASPDLTPRLLG
ncbi:PfaD family polyunsaturated fatty acid/polyketide biosynthesis protein [Streptomyces sp. NPDC051546]|uniref:PfaD family polyunsaturated fatty acid/polyketide biosynthesis protein n=1 Tax=Streptomyces sp. NPDC051546 TaxID=3365655 RepID=UPI003790FB3B